MSVIKKFWKSGLQIVLFAAVITLALWLSRLATESNFIQDLILKFGYGGVFMSSVLSGFNLVVPIPIVAFFPLFLVSGLNPWITIFFIVLGVTLADIIAYFIGKTGRQFVSLRTKKTIVRFEKLGEKYYWIPLVLLFLFASFVPLPNEILVIPLGFLGYRFIYILPSLLLGNAVFNTLSAFGVLNLFRLLI